MCAWGCSGDKEVNGNCIMERKKGNISWGWVCVLFFFYFKKWLEMFKCLKVRKIRNGLRENGLVGTEVQNR